MYVTYSYLANIDIGYCIICQDAVSGPFDFCGDCYAVYREDRSVPWLRSLQTSAQAKRRQAQRDRSVDLVSLDAIQEKLIEDRFM